MKINSGRKPPRQSGSWFPLMKSGKGLGVWLFYYGLLNGHKYDKIKLAPTNHASACQVKLCLFTPSYVIRGKLLAN